MSRILTSAAGIVCTLVAACGGGNGGGSHGNAACSATREKDFVLDTAREWYLFSELLPDGVDAGQFATAAELLDALTADARAEGKDRFFSYVTTRQADDAILQEGQFVGFGFRSRIEDGRFWLTDVYEDSPAERRRPLARHGDHAPRFGQRLRARWPRCWRTTRTSTRPLARPPRASSAASVSCRRAAQPRRACSSRTSSTILPVRAGRRPRPRAALESGRSGRLSQPAHVHLHGRGAAARRLCRVPRPGRRVLHRGPALQRRRARQHRRTHRRPERRRRATIPTSTSTCASTRPSPGNERRAPLPPAGGIGGSRAHRLHHHRPHRLGERARHQFAGALGRGRDRRRRHARQAGRPVRHSTCPAATSGSGSSPSSSPTPMTTASTTTAWRGPCHLPAVRMTTSRASPAIPAEGSTAEALSWLGTGACSEVLRPRHPPPQGAGGLRIPQSRRPTAAQAYLPGLF